MNRLYLRHIELKQFRSFATLSVDIVPAPGVLIVHGSNGLGKSSLFDGLEWALTGKIDHFRKATKGVPPRNYLRRWGAPTDAPTEVNLGFSEGSWICRGLASGLDVQAGVADVTAFLRASEWKKDISDLHRYLLLTHFLGQSTVSRMTHRDADERWEFLQEPAQSDWATEIVNALHGHGNSGMARAYNRRVKELTQHAEKLDRLLTEEQQQWEAGRADGALSEEDALSEGHSILAEQSAMLAETGQLGRAAPTLASDGLIEALRKVQESALEAVRHRTADLERAGVLVTERQRVDVEAAEHAAALALTRDRLEAAGQGQAGARALRDESREAREAASSALRSANDALARLTALRGRHDAVARGQVELQAAHALSNQLTDRLYQAEERVRMETRRRRGVERLQAHLEATQVERARLSGQLAAIGAAERALRARDDSASALTDALAAAGDTDSKLSATEAALRSASADVEQLKRELTVTRKAVDQLAAAVASVAANLPADACECPVCASPFASADELRAKASTAAERLAPVVAALELRLSAAVTVRNEAESQRGAVLKERHAVEECRLQSQRATEQLAEALAKLDSAPKLAASGLGVLRGQTAAALERAEQRRRRAERWVHLLVGDPTRTAAASRRVAKIRDEISGEWGVHRAKVQRLQTSIREEEESLRADASVLGLPSALSAEAIASAIKTSSDTIAATTRRLEAAEATLQLAQAASDEKDEEVAQLLARTQELTRQADSARDRIGELEAAWSKLAIAPGPISWDALQHLLRSVPTLRARLNATDTRIRRLHEGRNVWMCQQRHRETLELLRTSVDAAPTINRVALRETVDDLKNRLMERARNVEAAKRIAQSAGATVTEKVQAFNRAYLLPLSALMNRINRSILSEPEIGLDLKLERGKVEQRAVAPSGAPPHVSELDPQLVHSEGQMAALAVSMLCAASLSFPWSRWRGLIMDDPLQHNDVVHAAAFADMLRNLILDRKYQVLLSTHDVSQAEFLRRKFLAADVPCTMVHLLGRGTSGVDSLISGGGSSESTTSASANG